MKLTLNILSVIAGILTLVACTREPPRVMLVVQHGENKAITCNTLGGSITINNQETVRIEGIEPGSLREQIESLTPHMPGAPVTITAWCDNITEELTGVLAPRPPGHLPQSAVVSLPYVNGPCEPTTGGPRICISADSLLQPAD